MSESLVTLQVQDAHLYNNIEFENSVYVEAKSYDNRLILLATTHKYTLQKKLKYRILESLSLFIMSSFLSKHCYYYHLYCCHFQKPTIDQHLEGTKKIQKSHQVREVLMQSEENLM